jgi:hypothetical protein
MLDDNNKVLHNSKEGNKTLPFCQAFYCILHAHLYQSTLELHLMFLAVIIRRIAYKKFSLKKNKKNE